MAKILYDYNYSATQIPMLHSEYPGSPAEAIGHVVQVILRNNDERDRKIVTMKREGHCVPDVVYEAASTRLSSDSKTVNITVVNNNNTLEVYSECDEIGKWIIQS